MHTQSDVASTYTGRPVLDEHGIALGSITDVVCDDHGRVEYLLVDPGIFRPSHYVPVHGSYDTARGEVVVPWDKFWFKQAPKATGQRILSALDRHMLEVHYA